MRPKAECQGHGWGRKKGWILTASRKKEGTFGFKHFLLTDRVKENVVLKGANQ